MEAGRVTKDGSNFISAAHDSAGTVADDFSQGTAAQRPLWVDAAPPVARFDGSVDSLDGAQSAELLPNGTAAFTFVCWTKQASVSGGHTIFSQWNATPRFIIRNETAWAWRAYIATASDSGINGVCTLDRANSWTHVAVVYDGAGAANADRLKIYLEGAPQTLSFTGSIPASLYNSPDAIQIGRRAGGDFFNGDLRTVCVYSRALSANEVARHRTGTRVA